MKRTGLNWYNKQEEILKRVRDKEYIKRCVAVNICPWCGKDLKDIEAPSSHFVTLSCPDKKCEGYERIRKSDRDGTLRG